MLEPQDMTTWKGLLNVIVGAFSNPYLLCLCVWNMWSAANDPTTKGIKDSSLAMSYEKPKEDI